MTVEELYAAYMDDEKSFAEDILEWFGPKHKPEGWESQYGMYLPTYDPAQVKLAGRTRDLDYRKARDILDISTKVADRVYATEADTISTGLGTEIAKGKAISGTLGLRSGSLEGALEDTMTIASNKIENLGDRALIQTEEDKNTYNAAMVDSALDFEKTEREEKEEFYDRTMKAVMRLSDIGALKETCECKWHIDQTWYAECRNQGGTRQDCEDASMTEDCKDIETGEWC